MSGDTPKQPPIAFSLWFELEMERRGVTAADVSRDTGIYQSTLSKYRNGIQMPSPENAHLLATYFGVPADRVLDIAGKGPGRRSASVAYRQARELLDQIPEDLIPIALLWLEALADDRRWSRYRTALIEARRFANDAATDDGPGDGPEVEGSPETGETA